MFPLWTFHSYVENIPSAPAHGVRISQLIWYSRACASYQDFLDRGLLLTRKLLNQGFLLVKLKSSLRKFYGRHHDLVDRYEISVSQMTTIYSNCHKHFPVLSSLMTYHRICNWIKDYGCRYCLLFRGTWVVSGVRVTRSSVLCVCFVDHCLFFCTFSFSHCVVCSSSIYGFWLPLWYLQTIISEKKE
jgi:hypothetical protein